MQTQYKNYDELPLSLSAKDISSILGISKGSAYTLMHSNDFPTIQVGRKLIVAKSKFIEWVNRTSETL